MGGRDNQQQLLGFCPQFDAIFGLLTAREHLEFYGRLKGVPKAVLAEVVQRKISELSLEPHADKMARGYSGGNKRKLSVAIATIGEPKIVFLDEPSTGMDPSSRRKLWSVIAELSKRAGVVLTTHSMDEAEALGSRIAIMVDGSLRCLGSAQHIKSAHGDGLHLEVNLSDPAAVAVDAAVAELGLAPDAALDKGQVAEALGGAGPEAAAMHAECFAGGGEGSSAALLVLELELGKGVVTAKALAEWLCAERTYRAVDANLRLAVPEILQLDRQGARLRYSIPPGNGTLAEMFAKVEDVKLKGGVDASSLGQVTLETIFNNFARLQSSKED